MSAPRGSTRRDAAPAASARRASGGRGPGRPLRLDADPEDVGRGLAGLVVVVLELVREVLERQAIRRMDGGDLSARQVEELGRALIEIRRALERLRESFDVSEREVDDAVTRAQGLLTSGLDRDLAGGVGAGTAGRGTAGNPAGPAEKSVAAAARRPGRVLVEIPENAPETVSGSAPENGSEKTEEMLRRRRRR